MPSRPVPVLLALVEAELDALKASIAAGTAGPGVQGRIRWLERRAQYYRDHKSRLTAYQSTVRSLGTGHSRKLGPVDTPPEFALDVAALL